MVVIKGKEKVLRKKIQTASIKLSRQGKKVLKRRQDAQPIQGVTVGL